MDIAPEQESDDAVAEDARLRAESIQIVRDLILKAHPDLVPELVGGETIAQLMASLEPAREAYRRLVDAVRSAAPVVPAGGASAVPPIELLTADGMIKHALAQARK